LPQDSSRKKKSGREEAGEKSMFSHITVGCNNLEEAVAFYTALLTPLGLKQRVMTPDGGPPAACFVKNNQPFPRFYIYQPFNRKPATAGNGTMVAFIAASAQEVDAAYAAGIAHGGQDEGKPSERPHYAQGYYGAYLRDLAGNKLHIVYRGDLIGATP
jgi:catechol 2,3-dioxygenase-like lactoylglutathione lyase family enzyme